MHYIETALPFAQAGRTHKDVDNWKLLSLRIAIKHRPPIAGTTTRTEIENA